MEILKQSEVNAAVQISEVEAKLLSLAMEYWEQTMDTGSPVVAGLSDRLREITRDFDTLMGDLEET